MKPVYPRWLLAGLLALRAGAEAAPADPATALLARGDAESGVELYGKLREADKNLVFSPYSVSGALAMLYEGARGATAEEIARVLRLPAGGEALAKAVAGLSGRLRDHASADGLVFQEAFGLCLAKLGFIVSDRYKELLRTSFGAEVFQARDAAPVNAWAEKKTQGKVKGLLKRLPQSALCVLLDAVYFKGDWERAFDPQETEQSSFSTERGRQVPARMMRQTGPFRLLRDDAAGFAAVELPYRGGRFSMVVFLPAALGGLEAFEGALSPARLEDSLRRLDALKPVEVELSLPRFALGRRLELIPALKAMGLSRPFDAGAADLSGIGGKPGELAVSQVAHKAVLEVDEKGTVAAAATAVVVTKGGPPRRPVRFEADHPFFFVVRDKDAAAVLFLGRLVDPSQRPE